MPDFGIFRGFNEKLFGDKLVAGQLPTQLGLIGSEDAVKIDPDAQAFFNRVNTAGGTLSATEKEAVNTLVLQMKDDGIWTKMKAIYPMVGASAAACAQNLKSSSFTGSFTSGWTFASTGATPNGTSAYMDTGLNVNNVLDGTNSHLSYYSRTSFTSGSDEYIMGAYQTNPVRFYALDYSSTNNLLGSLGNLSPFNFGSISDTTGFLMITKKLNNEQKLFRNNVTLDTETQTYTDKPNLNIYLGALNINGNASAHSPVEVAFSSIGDGLSDNEASDLYTAAQAFNTTLSRQL
jgi:hypothetical protein